MRGGTGSACRPSGRPCFRSRGALTLRLARCWGRRAQVHAEALPKERSACPERVLVPVSDAEVPGQREGSRWAVVWERLYQSGACVPGGAQPQQWRAAGLLA